MYKRFILIVAALAFLFQASVYAGSDVSASAAVQLTKKGGDASMRNIEGSFVRGELKASTKVSEKAGGLLHLRFQVNMADNNVKVTSLLRQAYWDLGASIINFRAGRWYSIYTPGAYFGRYLHGVSSKGSGSMCTNYSIVDGGRITAGIEKAKTDIHLGILPQDFNFENIRTMILLQSNPVEPLKFAAGTNLQVYKPDSLDAAHRLIVNARVEIIKNLMPFAEFAITDLSEAADNMWFLFGVDIPTGPVLDQLRFETEIKKDRLGADTDGNFAWMVIIVKKVLGLKFNLNFGADPKSLDSESPGDIGAHFRMSAKF
jgi:hypothetical protein